MAQTPLSADESYLPVDEFLKRVDLRTIGDWASDDGLRVAAGSLASNDNVLAALDDASGLVESACLVGKRYTPEDLAALEGVGLRMLYRLCAGLALGFLAERRPDRTSELPASATWAFAQLQLLQAGERTFSLLESAEAGLPNSHIETRREIEDRQGIVFQTREFFGTRSDRKDPTRR